MFVLVDFRPWSRPGVHKTLQSFLVRVFDHLCLDLIRLSILHVHGSGLTYCPVRILDLLALVLIDVTATLIHLVHFYWPFRLFFIQIPRFPYPVSHVPGSFLSGA